MMKRFAAIVVFLFTFLVNSTGQNQLFFAQNMTGGGWNILNGTYVTSFDLSAIESTQRTMYVLNDTCLFVLGSTNTFLYQYSIGSSSLTYRRYYNPGISGASSGLDFKADGTKMYIATSSEVYEFTLSTAWSISSASNTASQTFSTYSANIGGIKIADDGYSIYIGSNDYNTIRKYPISTAWSISTASSTGFTQSLNVGTVDLYDFKFGNNGSLIVVTNSFSTQLKVYTLSTAYDLSTGSYTGAFTTTDAGFPYGIGFLKNGTEMYISGNNSGFIYKYSIQ